MSPPSHKCLCRLTAGGFDQSRTGQTDKIGIMAVMAVGLFALNNGYKDWHGSGSNWESVCHCHHRRSQDFVCGGVLFSQKSWQPFFSRSRLNIPPNLSHPAKLLKIDSCSGWGCTSCPAEVHLHIFPVNLAWKNFSPPWGMQVHPLHPPGYAYDCHL